jgi:hypothetical protein
MITLSEYVLPVLGFVDYCKFVLELGFVTPLRIWLCSIKVLVIGCRDRCVTMVDVILRLWEFSCLFQVGGHFYLLDYTCLT